MSCPSVIATVVYPNSAASTGLSESQDRACTRCQEACCCGWGARLWPGAVHRHMAFKPTASSLTICITGLNRGLRPMQRLIMQCVSGWCHYCLRIVSILLHNAALRRHVAWCMVYTSWLLPRCSQCSKQSFVAQERRPCIASSTCESPVRPLLGGAECSVRCCCLLLSLLQTAAGLCLKPHAR